MAPSSVQILQNASDVKISHSSFNVQTVDNYNLFTSSTRKLKPTQRGSLPVILHGLAFNCLQNATASSALHNSGERFQPPKCHPNTRVAILDRLMGWILGNFEAESVVMWLYGPAGAGKSAIAQTLAEWSFARRLLLGAFIFSRTDPRRNHIGPLAATLAYQIALVDKSLRSFIEEAVDANPLIFLQSLETQLLTLVVHPLLKFLDNTSNMPPFPPLIIVDGLDECLNVDAQCHFINVVSDLVHEHRLPIKFLVASRPEQHLVVEFNSDTISDILARLALDNSWKPDADIYLFLSETFHNVGIPVSCSHIENILVTLFSDSSVTQQSSI